MVLVLLLKKFMTYIIGSENSISAIHTITNIFAPLVQINSAVRIVVQKVS